jgi:hypothetical protein
MEGVKTIITLLGDLATFFWLTLRPQSTLAAENLFLRKQLAMFQERKAKPRRPDTPIRIALVLLSRLFNWRDALVIVQPRHSSMAPSGLPPVLALEVTTRTPTDTCRAQAADSRDGYRQSLLGRGAHCQ